MTTTARTPALLFSIVMPAYNEEAVLETTLNELTRHLDSEGFDYEVVVVNDNSSDGTAEVLRSCVERMPRVRHVDNPGPNGYGYAIRKGLEHYRGDAMVIVTSDGSDSPADVASYFRKIEEGYDCAFGARFVPGTTVTNYPPFKKLVNRVANFGLARVLGADYGDFTNGFKCYRRHVVEQMQPLASGQFNITVEMAVKAVLGGHRYAVVPTNWSQRAAGTSSFKIAKMVTPYAASLAYALSAAYLKKSKR